MTSQENNIWADGAEGSKGDIAAMIAALDGVSGRACKFGPHCTALGTGCTDSHRTACRAAGCQKPYCLWLGANAGRPSVAPCAFAAHCTDAGCDKFHAPCFAGAGCGFARCRGKTPAAPGGQCKFGAHCTDPACPDSHDVACKFGARCSKVGCRSKAAGGAAGGAAGDEQCPFGPHCTDAGCAKRHDARCKFGEGCRNPKCRSKGGAACP